MDLIDYFCRQYKHRKQDELTVQLLGIRLFNASASALKLLLSGYYQTAALQERDLLEMAFLLDLFTTIASARRRCKAKILQRNTGMADLPFRIL